MCDIIEVHILFAMKIASKNKKLAAFFDEFIAFYGDFLSKTLKLISWLNVTLQLRFWFVKVLFWF